MEIYDRCVCWPSLIRGFSLEWELVSEAVSQRDISQKRLPVDTHSWSYTQIRILSHFIPCHAHMHTPYLSFPQQEVTYPTRYTKAYTLTHTKQCSSLIWSSTSCVIEVMEAQTGWGLSSDVSDRKLRCRVIYFFSTGGR